MARWYCSTGRTTFSLLADCLAAKLPGSLAELEEVRERMKDIDDGSVEPVAWRDAKQRIFAQAR